MSKVWHLALTGGFQSEIPTSTFVAKSAVMAGWSLIYAVGVLHRNRTKALTTSQLTREKVACVSVAKPNMVPRRGKSRIQFRLLQPRVLALMWSLLFLLRVSGGASPVVNFVHSSASLLSGGLTDCPTPLEETCNGGMATVSAYIRHYSNASNEPTLFIPECDRTSPFVQMHPLQWTVNRLVLNEHFGWTIFRCSLSLLTSSRDLSYLRTPDMPLLVTNALIPPSSPWYDFTKMVHYDVQTRLAVMIVVSSSQPNSWPGIASALNGLNHVAEVNAGVTGKDRWIPVVVYDDDYAGFEEFLAAVSAHQNPPQLVLSTTAATIGPSSVGKYTPMRKTKSNLTSNREASPWVGRFDESSQRSHHFRIVLGPDNVVSNVTLFEENLQELPLAMKDDKYIGDQVYLKSLADKAAVKDPVVGTSDAMPLTRIDDTRMCQAGECIIGNLWTDAYRWKVGADVAFVPSGGLRGPGWPAGEVRMSDLWKALPFANTLCSGIMSGITMFKLLNFSTATATFQSTYTDMGDRLVQVSGLRYTYNTKLNNSRLISVEVWDNATQAYVPLERLKLYSFATGNFMCKVFNPFPSFFGSTEIEGEVPGVIDDRLAQNVVGEYLSQLGRPYNTTKQGRLQNDTSALSYLNLVQTKDNCPDNTYWDEPFKTCFPCLAGPDGIHVSFSDRRIELETERGVDAPSRVILSNREVFDVSVFLKSSPGWVEVTNSTSTELIKGEQALLLAGDSIALDFVVRTEQLEAATALGSVSFGILDASQNRPDCSYDGGDVSFDVFVRVAPLPNLNQLSTGIRGAGLALMGIISLSSMAFSAWVYRYHRTRVVRASQPMFLQLICLGTLIMGTGIIPLSIDDGVASTQGCNMACMSLPWLLSMGFIISFSALFSKIWRINKLFSGAAHFQKLTLTEKDVLVPFAVLFTLNFAFLLTWTLVEPLHWVRVPIQNNVWNTYGTCTIGGTASIAFLVLIVVINVGSLFLACLQAYRARHVSVEFSESKYIGMAMYSWLQVLIVGIPVLFLVTENPGASFFLQSALIFVLCMSMLLLIFVPKLVSFWQRNARKAFRQQGVSQEAVVVTEGVFEGGSEDTNPEGTAGLTVHQIAKIDQELRIQLRQSQDRLNHLEEQLYEKDKASMEFILEEEDGSS